MGKKRTHEQFLELMSQVHPEMKVLGHYVDALTPVEVLCKVCGERSQPRPANLLGSINRKPTGCRVCAGNVQMSSEEFNRKLVEQNPSVEALDDYPGSNKKLMHFRCRTCGATWITSAQSALQGHSCSKCSIDRIARDQMLSQEVFEERVSANNPSIVVKGQYQGSHALVLCECTNCNYQWEAIAWNILQGEGCPSCNAGYQSSYTERFLLASLERMLGKDAVLPRDTNVIGMELDIYIPRLAVAIEPGSWHWHRRNVERDREKRRLCAERGIRLITIYDGFDSKEPPFDDDCLIYDINLGQPNNREALRSLAVKIMHMLGIENQLTEADWRIIAKVANKKSRINDQIFKERMSALRPDLTILGHYEGYYDKLQVCCSKGHEFSSSPANLLQGYGCKRCSIDRMVESRRLTQDTYVSRVHEACPSVQVLSKYRGMSHRVQLRCDACGKEWSPKAATILSGHKCRL